MKSLPKHLAIIMDGNGRWAENAHQPRIEGHRRGVEVSENIIDACLERGIRYLTLYAFSEENWNRPVGEVEALMELLGWYVASRRPKMLKNGIRFQTIGDVDRLPSHVREEIEASKMATANCDRMTLILALSYGARQEICRAINALVARGQKTVTPELLSQVLDTHDLPDPDLLIRTSGEYRMSNFLLWQMAYTELYFTETLWPDFNEEELDMALASFQKRERRFGLTSGQLRSLCL
ncbi:MAG: di-trans,poly-cis-decaprenylcistransferase [Deltaproteobacteria bacterium]|nr:di-trans,poly-cis-decaprenylcistransferase [Deltaproteobacteria bacterium]